ncbi:hypothetical protein Golob_021972, partial [Gossypium lobatum]|nr:hypothetical protein [Gossypium lobatum]
VSAPASEFYWGKGNLIFYPGGLFDSPRDPDRLVFVFDLETGTACPLETCPAYCNLFWPPPQWVTSSESVISLTEVISNSTHSISSATPENECMNPESDFTISLTEVISNSTHSISSATPENECMYSESGFALSPTPITPKRVTYLAGKEVGSEQPSPSSNYNSLHQFHSQETWSHDSFLSCGIVLAPWYLPSPLSQIVLWHYRYGTSFLPSMTIHPDSELKFPEAASLTCSCWCD